MNFFALSQAPPAVFRKIAIKTPVEVANMMKEAVHLPTLFSGGVLCAQRLFNSSSECTSAIRLSPVCY